MVVVDQGGSTKIEQNQKELDRYPAMKRILDEYSEIETEPSDDRVRSTQIGQLETQIGQLETGLRGVRRLKEEYLEIKSNPSDDFDCRMLERNPYEWQFGIRGASGTEFEGGIYHGQIQFPKEYPSKPPSFKLLTENGRFKTHKKIRIRRLDDWQPSWRVRDALDALIDEMPTPPDDELGSVEYDKEERRYFARKSRDAAPKFGTSERQKLIAEIHEYLEGKSPPVPQLSPLQASIGTGDIYVGGSIVSGNTFNATNADEVGIFGSMNASSDEDRKCLPSLLKLFR